MKKRIISLLICVCLCLTLLPAVCLTAFAGVGFTVRVNGSVCGSGTTTLPNGEVTVDCTGSKVTITLDSCKVGSSWECYDGANKYNCGLLFLGDANEPADVNLILKGSNEIIPSVLILNASSLTVTSIGDGNLTVHTNFTTHCPVYLDKTDLTVTGDQSNMDSAFMCDELTVDRPAVKGGGSLGQTMLTINTNRYFGLSCSNLTVNSGIINISAQNLGLLMMPSGEAAPQLQINGGITDIYGGVAAVYICGYYGDMSNIKLGDKIGDANGNVLASTEFDGGFCKQSWIATDEEYPLYFCDADGNNDFWYDYDLMSNAAKSVCLKEIPFAYVTFDCGDFGAVNGQQKWISGYEYGSRIGVLPVPTNTTFTEGSFNGMYFEGWALKNNLGETIDETFVLDRNIELEAVWMEGQGTSFTDVKETDWFYSFVNYCNGQKLMSGTSSTKFSPNDKCTRAMIVMILYRMEGLPKVMGENVFTDVPNGQWYTDAVVWANENGIVAGYGNGIFKPNDNVTREQLAAIMRKYADYTAMYTEEDCLTIAGFPDSDKVSSWAGGAMSWAFGVELLSGKAQKDGPALLDPTGHATRAELATILMKYTRKTQNALTFYGDVVVASMPEMYQGNVSCHKITTENGDCILQFYCKQEYEASEGMGGKLFAIVSTAGYDYLDDPTFDSFLCTVNDTDGERLFNVYRQRNTDVQCDQTLDTVRGARFYSMLNLGENVGMESFCPLASIGWYYIISYGVG